MELDAADLYEWNEFLKRLPNRDLVELVLSRITIMEEELLLKIYSVSSQELLERDFKEKAGRKYESEEKAK